MPKLFYRAGYRYVLDQPLCVDVQIYGLKRIDTMIVLSERGELAIFPEYAWNGAGASLWQSYLLTDKTNRRASCVHDALVQLLQAGLLDMDHKEAVDLVYKRICIEDGMSSWRASAQYWMLKKFGRYKLQEKIVLED